MDDEMWEEFELYWHQYGELSAAMAHGSIKVFAEQIWASAWEKAEKTTIRKIGKEEADGD